MKSFLTLVVILSVAIGIFYAVTSSNLLMRYSYDVYACASPSGETIELKFNDIENRRERRSHQRKWRKYS
jgi:hypothetical protein